MRRRSAEFFINEKVRLEKRTAATLVSTMVTLMKVKLEAKGRRKESVVA